jgi:hypothetical protein
MNDVVFEGPSRIVGYPEVGQLEQDSRKLDRICTDKSACTK